MTVPEKPSLDGLEAKWDAAWDSGGVHRFDRSRTRDERCRRTSQLAFLHNLARGEAYLAEAPTLWDVSFQTAVAQAELEDRERPGAFHRISFHRPDGQNVDI